MIKKVLIVDDEQDILTSLKLLILNMGYAPTAVSRGKDALSALQKEKFDLVLLDVLMPGMSGREVLERIRKDPKLKNQKVAFLTVVELSRQGVGTIEKLNPVEYFRKPIDVIDFRKKIQKILGSGQKPSKIKTLKGTNNVIINLKTKNYNGAVANIYKRSSKDYKNICFITITKSYDAFVKGLRAEGANCSGCYFIDCISASAGKVKGSKNFIYVASPADLNGISAAIDKMMKSHKIDLFILDSISSLLVYNKETAVLKFLQIMMKKIKSAKTNAIYLVSQNDAGKEVISDISLFADQVVDV